MTDSLTTWLDSIEKQSPTFERSYQDNRLQALMANWPIHQFTCPVISVAGTNGKGSSIAILEAITQLAGFRVGVFTSPHVLNFNERIRIAGTPVSDQQIIDAFVSIKQRADDIKMRLSYFEYSFLASLVIFQQQACDLVILEVGLGGRLDSVNLVDADAALITSIGLDHQAILGDTREAIAIEKAGIMRPKKIAVCADANPPSTLLNEAKRIASHFLCLGYQFNVTHSEQTWHLQYRNNHLYDLPITPLGIENAAGALMILQQLRLPISLTQIHQGLQQACSLGRWQLLPDYPCEVRVDVGHNPDAIAYLNKTHLKPACKKRTLAVVAMYRDKEIAETCQTISPYIDAWYVAAMSDQERGADEQTMLAALESIGTKNVLSYADVPSAFKQALADARPNDRVIVFGSFVTVKDVLSLTTEPSMVSG